MGRVAAKGGAGAAVKGLGGGEVTRRRFRGPALGGDGPQLRGGVAAFGFLERLRGLGGGAASVLSEASWSPGSSALGSADPGTMSPTFSLWASDALSGIQCLLFPPTPSPFFPVHGKIPSRACVVMNDTIIFAQERMVTNTLSQYSSVLVFSQYLAPSAQVETEV